LYFLTDTGEIPSASAEACGEICSLNFTSKQDGRYYPLLRKTVDCPSVLRRMATLPATSITRPPVDPPQGTVDNFTQYGQCPIARRKYLDSTNHGRLLYYSESSFMQVMERNSKGFVIGSYRDPQSHLHATIQKYRQYIHNRHVAVIGSRFPWAEAMLMNLQPRLITTLEYGSLIIKHSRLKNLTPHQFAVNYLEAMSNGKPVRCFCHRYTGWPIKNVPNFCVNITVRILYGVIFFAYL